MKLKDRAAVYWRIHLLLKNSPDFRNMFFPPLGNEESYRIFQKRFFKNGQADDNSIIDYYCLASNERQREYAIEVLREIYGIADDWSYVLFRAANNNELSPEYPKMMTRFQDGILHLEIRTPMTKQEWNKAWLRVAMLQLLFLVGANEKNVGTHGKEYFKQVEKLYRRRPSVKKKLHDVMKQSHDMNFLLYIDHVWREIESEDPWKENPKQQLDEDIQILRLHREYGEKAEDEYKKIKLVSWLDTKGKKIADIDLKQLSSDEILLKYKRDFWDMEWKNLRAKDFNRRVEKVMEAFCLE